MSMSTHVVGIVPPDEEWQKMKAVWDACRAAGIDLPDSVGHYFDDEAPDPKGVVVAIEAKQWDDGDMCSGLEVDLDKVRKDVRTIRFYNSY